MESVTKSQLQSLAPSLDPRSLNVLAEMYEAKSLCGTESGDPILINEKARITPNQGASIRELMINNSVSRSLEVGFAYGFSTIWILDALRGKPNGRHIAIDPFEKSSWHGIGLKNVEKVQFETDFEWSIFLLSGVITLLIAVTTVGFKSIRAATANPVDSLRYE